MYKAGPRAEKLDLGVGIYKDKAGNTPIMRSVGKAQTQLVQTQPSGVSRLLAMAGLTWQAFQMMGWKILRLKS